MISVVIPAHNEAAVIGRCLASITDGAQPGELEVVVVCNGCTDNTAEVAASYDFTHVLETDIASKSAALNLGDQAVHGFPRFFVDADVVLPLESVRAVASTLATTSLCAATPRLQVDLDDRPWSVRAFYRVWLSLPYVKHSLLGSGVYAVSAAGRARFDRFPPITADDLFVRRQFAPHERTIVDDVAFTITPPQTLAGIVAIKTRGHFGEIELGNEFPQLAVNEDADHAAGLRDLAAKPAMWPSLAVYVGVRLAARSRARRRWRQGDHGSWERDDSSRQSAATASPLDGVSRG